MEERYFFDVFIERDNLARDFPRIMRRIRELYMESIFAKPAECNLHVVKSSMQIGQQSLGRTLSSPEVSDEEGLGSQRGQICICRPYHSVVSFCRCTRGELRLTRTPFLSTSGCDQDKKA
ncbi:hypothetical protein H5410_022164 [Solanum commersonii]|uniref:Uncharacterized protein n=1 Tax=Solanum commersonii TaxID=4109 RepID=A0A9J5ZD57_SOLCO|nr:hypothetical protein H5410_022164 [Solanum commersonii]